MRYLTVDEVLVLHDYAIERFGGSPGLASLERLEASLAVPMQTMFGQELYPDLWSKAAILCYLLIKNHPFVDGNKRTALYALLRFLELNGYTIAVADNDELYRFTMDVATSALDKEEIEAWLRMHTRKLDT